MSPLAHDAAGRPYIATPGQPAGENLPATGIDDTTGEPWAPTLPVTGPGGLPLIPALDPALVRTGDPAELHAELKGVMERTMLDHPRSQQDRIGPSEIGTPCTRKLAYKLGRAPVVNPPRPAWRPQVGTDVHAGQAERFVADNVRLGWARWLVEMRVSVGEIDGVDITGSCDLYDRATGDVGDWKIVGSTTLRDARRNGPKRKYRVQPHLYGRGYTRRGLPVRNVHVLYLPAAGELGDAVFWSEPYDEQVAVDALARATGIAQATRAVGFGPVAAASEAADDFCTGCPWFAPADPDPAAGRCPGAVATPVVVEPRGGGAFGLDGVL